MPSAADITELLRAATVTPEAARRKPAAGGTPALPGFFVWWVDCDAVGALEVPRDAAQELGVLYVGSAPVIPHSSQTLRRRICGQDLRGGIAHSPMRRVLCALLWQSEGWELERRGTEIRLAASSAARLTAWQDAHMRVSWCASPKPWQERAAVIKAMQPPLNLAEARSHPNNWLLSEAKQRLRTTALQSHPRDY